MECAAYCVVAVESVGRQVPIAFLERVKEEFNKKYGGGKASTAAANSLDREFGCVFSPSNIYEYLTRLVIMMLDIFTARVPVDLVHIDND